MLDKSKSLIAFVHIEKAAGTTFIHILRHNYFLAYMDVRPFFRESDGLFLARDLRVARRLLPGLKCIGGHAITPYSGLESECPDIKFISVMRDPVKRYLSQYQHWVEKKKLDINFEKFLAIKELKNFQTKKYAGEDNLEMAMDILREKFLLVGYVEAYDEFLVLLQQIFGSIGFEGSYRQKNLAHNKIAVNELAERYYDQIEENNRNDIVLYEYVKDKLFPCYVQKYSGNFSTDLQTFQKTNSEFNPPMMRRYVDYAFRKVYIEPVSGMIRLINGKPYKGSY